MNKKTAIGLTLAITAAVAQEVRVRDPRQAPTTLPPAVVALDLATLELPQRTEVAAGVITVELRNALPMGPYRLSFRYDQFPAHPQNLTAAMDFAKLSMPKECEELSAKALQLFRVADERALADAVAALEQSKGVCAQKAFIFENSLARTKPHVTLTLEEGKDVGLRLERLDAQGQVVRSWSTTFVGRVQARGWKFKSEEEWLVHDIRLDLARLVAAANGEPMPEDVAPRPDFQPAPHIWAPEAYVEEVERSLSNRKVGPATDGQRSTSQREALQDLRAATIEAQNSVLSSRLTANLLDAEAHEASAFLLGTLALREAAGPFSDTRPALSRMTAHLAFARALRHRLSPSASGRFAGILLSTLVGRQREALDALSALDAAAKSPDAVWKQCLQTENDGDWRRLSPKGPLVERIVLFRALSRAASPHKATVIFGADSLEPIPDWGRIAFESGASVEVGNLFFDGLMGSELQEVAAVRGTASGDLKGWLGQRWGPLVRSSAGRTEVRVLDEGAWSEFAARHVLAAAASIEGHLENALGLPDEAKSASEAFEQKLGSLPLYPLVKLVHKPPADCAGLASVITGSPERISAANWHAARVRCQKAVPSPAVWFRSSFPAGTAFEADKRLQSEARLSVDLAEATRLRSLAPFASQVVDTWLQRRFPPPAQATVAQRAEAFGAAAHYREDVLQQIFDASLDDPRARTPVARALCDLDSDTCVTLAWLLAGSADADGAAAAYRRAFSGMDEVAASTEAKWLVDYELGRGHRDEAKAVVERMAGTGSAAGFDLLGWFHERNGNLSDAEGAYQALAERYHDTGSLDGFYVRRSIAGDQRYAAKAKEAMKRLFPFGLERLEPAKLEAAAAGVQIAEADELLVKAGVAAYDIIVGLDGYRIRDGEQWETLRQLRTVGDLHLYVWHLATQAYLSVSYPTIGMRDIAAPRRRTSLSAAQQFEFSHIEGLTAEEWGERAAKGGIDGKQGVANVMNFIIQHRATVSALFPVLRSGDEPTKFYALNRIMGMPPEELVSAAPVVEPLAEKAPLAVRQLALTILGSTAAKYPAGLTLIVKSLDDPEAAVRGSAAGALPGAGALAAKALPKLREMRSSDPDAMVRASATMAINSIEALAKSPAPESKPK